MNTLLLIDLQNDFLPGGALAVREGDQVIPLANRFPCALGIPEHVGHDRIAATCNRRVTSLARLVLRRASLAVGRA